MKLSGRLLFKFSLVALFATGAFASQISSCASEFSSCTVYEDGFVLSFLPNGAAVAGDVVLMDPGATTISDVFRIFNDLVDTGGGTGIGVSAFFYSSDEHNLPTTFSVQRRLHHRRPRNQWHRED